VLLFKCIKDVDLGFCEANADTRTLSDSVSNEVINPTIAKRLEGE